MKKWDIDYSSRFDDGRIREGRFTVEAENIRDALDEADEVLVAIECNSPEIMQTVIWNVAIITSMEDRPEEVF